MGFLSSATNFSRGLGGAFSILGMISVWYDFAPLIHAVLSKWRELIVIPWDVVFPEIGLVAATTLSSIILFMTIVYIPSFFVSHPDLKKEEYANEASLEHIRIPRFAKIFFCPVAFIEDFEYQLFLLIGVGLYVISIVTIIMFNRAGLDFTVLIFLPLGYTIVFLYVNFFPSIFISIALGNQVLYYTLFGVVTVLAAELAYNLGVFNLAGYLFN